MNNEPVAWMFKYNKIVDNNKPEKGDEHNWIPLYTHPAKELIEEKCYEVVFDGENYTTKLVEPQLKTLTDEEIIELKNALKDCEYRIYPSKKQWESYLVLEKHAKRLLRKAQEK